MDSILFLLFLTGFTGLAGYLAFVLITSQMEVMKYNPPYGGTYLYLRLFVNPESAPQKTIPDTWILAFSLLNRLTNSPKSIGVSRLSSGKPGKNILKIL
jgi:hypothetical protein